MGSISAMLGDDRSCRAERARRLVADGAKLLDVRSPAEFAAGHIDGAVNIPVDELAGRLPELGRRDDVIVVYCRSGRRSAGAVPVLEAAGFSVHDLGSIDSWYPDAAGGCTGRG